MSCVEHSFGFANFGMLGYCQDITTITSHWMPCQVLRQSGLWLWICLWVDERVLRGTPGSQLLCMITTEVRFLLFERCYYIGTLPSPAYTAETMCFYMVSCVNTWAFHEFIRILLMLSSVFWFDIQREQLTKFVGWVQFIFTAQYRIPAYQIDTKLWAMILQAHPDVSFAISYARDPKHN
jgi:hypothetical protein